MSLPSFNLAIKVPIATEIQFLENYIELEKIRIRHEVVVHFEKNIKSDFRIPPMLLMTFVEIFFKHGIDKSSTRNQIHITQGQQGDYLLFRTRNTLVEKPLPQSSTRFRLLF